MRPTARSNFRTASAAIVTAGLVCSLAMPAWSAEPVRPAAVPITVPITELATAPVVAPGNLISAATLAIATPRILGTTRVGERLRAATTTTGSVEPQTKRYTWYRDGTLIANANARFYRLTAADRKHRISVHVAVSAVGYSTVRKASARTAVIRPRAVDDPTNSQVVVNKQRNLQPKTYTPKGLTYPNISNNGQRLRTVAARALERMAAAARKDGVTITLLSGYRSYETQKAVFNQQVATYGRAVAEKQSARPGYSEHQTGFSGDLGGAEGCGITSCFSGTQAGKWLKKYAYRYGFILRYPDGYTRITGYAYEPWHYRYVGTTVAADMKRKGIKTLEQYQHLPAAPTY